MANFSDPYLLATQDIEASAKQAISCSIGENCSFPIDLFKIIDMWGIDIEIEHNPQNRDLAKIFLTQCPKIVINSQNSLNDIKELVKTHSGKCGSLRFSIAHELGHYFLKAHNDEEIRVRMLDQNTSYNRRKYEGMTEYQANAFAAALLMPEFAMKNHLNYTNKPIEMAEKISTDFGVSLTTAFLRLAKLSQNINACIHVDITSGNIKHVEYSKLWNDIRYEHYPYKVLKLNKSVFIPKYSATGRLLANCPAPI